MRAPRGTEPPRSSPWPPNSAQAWRSAAPCPPSPAPRSGTCGPARHLGAGLPCCRRCHVAAPSAARCRCRAAARRRSGLIRVDLPAPFGPMIGVDLARDADRGSMTSSVACSAPKLLRRDRVARTGVCHAAPQTCAPSRPVARPTRPPRANKHDHQQDQRQGSNVPEIAEARPTRCSSSTNSDCAHHGARTGVPTPPRITSIDDLARRTAN